jgi:prephenate dehydrogenase
MHIQRLAIIGVGLIGGSLALALKRARAVGEVVGCGRNAMELEKGVKLGVIDRYTTDAATAVHAADMIVVATPVGSMRSIFDAIRDHLAPDAVVSDAGSTKMGIIADARSALGAAYSRFVPAHPIAGTEKSGVSAAFADLYRNHRVILTPGAETDRVATARVRAMWQVAGAQVEDMTASEHDAILAFTSHLPHMVAYALVDCLARAEPTAELLRFAAGGFRDITRVASSHPVMWRDIALANRDELLKALRCYQQSIGSIAEAIERGDAEALLALFERARQTRGILAEPSMQGSERSSGS